MALQTLPSPLLSFPALALLLLLCLPAPAAPVDYSRVSLKGNGHAQDHFSLSVQAAARLLGRELDYETLYVLSTNCFAPCLDPGENCTAWWATGTGRDSSIDLVGRRLGLAFRRLPRPDGKGAPAMPAEGPALSQWLREYYGKPAVAAIREAQAAGEIVLTDREWPVKGPHGFYPWCWWGIITEARDDGTVLGAGLNGFTDNPLDGVGDMLAVSLEEPGMSLAEADFEVLCRAVSRVRGDVAPYLPGKRTLYGVAAVDRWIERMDQVPFCEACGDRSQGCAADTARPTYEGARVAARFLRACPRSFPAASHPHLAAAATCYERVAALLEPALTGKGPGSYQAFIGDLASQQAHVREVLRPLRTQLRRAADEMSAALLASVPRTAAVPRVPASQGDGQGLARGLQLLLARDGVRADYHTLMGDLGLAFLAQASPEAAHYDGAVDVGWWPLEPSCQTVYLDFAGRTVGRRLQCWGGLATWDQQADKGGGVTAQVRVARHLAAGEPVLANHDFWKVVSSCDGADQPLLGFCPCRPETKPERLGGPAWVFVALAEPQPPAERRAADREALRHAVALARGEVALSDGYLTGRRAYALWTEALRDVAHLGEARWHSNMVLHTTVNRASAAPYLRQMAARQPAAAARLEAAAALYEQALAKLKQANTGQAAMGAAEGRETLAKLVDELAAIETRAAAELEAALATMP